MKFFALTQLCRAASAQLVVRPIADVSEILCAEHNA